MAIVPTDAALGNLPSMRSGAQIVSIDDPGRVGRAIAGLGEAMEGAAAQLAQSWEQNSGLEDEAKFQAFQNERMLEVERLTTDTTPEQAKGLTLGYINDSYKPAAKQFLDSISPKSRAAYTAKLINLQGSTFKSVYGFEEKAQGLAGKNLIDGTLDNHTLPSVARFAAANDDPETKAKNLQGSLTEFKAIVDTLPYSVSAAARQELLANGELRIRKQFYDRLSPEEKIRVAQDFGFKPSDLVSPPTQAPVPGNVSEQIAGVISLGETGSSNPKLRQSNISRDTNNSQSYGFLGLNSGTGSAKVFASEHPELGLAGLTPGSADFNAKWRELANTNPDGLYAAQLDYLNKHSISPVRSKLSSVLPAEAASNPAVVAYFVDRHDQQGNYIWGDGDIAAMKSAWANSGGDVKKFFDEFNNYERQIMPGRFSAAIKTGVYGQAGSEGRITKRTTAALALVGLAPLPKDAGGITSPSPYNLRDLDPGYILDAADKAQRQLEIDYKNKLQADRLAVNQAIDDERGRVELAIRDGRPVNIDADIRNNPLLSDKIKAELINIYDAENSKQIEQQRVIGRFTSDDNINAFSKSDRGDANKFYELTGSADGLDKLDPKATSRLTGFIQKYGIIPDSAVDKIMSGINSRDAETRAAHLQFLNGLYRKDRVAFERDFPESAVKTAHAYESAITNHSIEAVTEKLDPYRDRPTQAAIEASRADAEKVFSSIKTKDMIDRGWDPSIGWDQPNDPTVTWVVNQFRSELKESFIEGWAIKADNNFALDYAVRQNKRNWGGSAAANNELMKYPPENYYPAVGNSHDWMTRQLKARLDRDFPGYKEYHITASRETESTLKMSNLTPEQMADPEVPKGPVYDVIVVGDGSKISVLKHFWFDPSQAIESERAEFTRRREIEIENQKVHQKILENTDLLPERAPGELEKSVIQDLGGVPGTPGPDGKIISPFGAAPAFRIAPAAPPANEVVPERFRTIEPSVSPMRRNTPTSPAAGFPRIGG